MVLGKIWKFLWNDNSILSWVVNIILAFVIVKFLIFPGLGLALGTSFPIVAVVSPSMDHQGDFDTWWTTHGSWYTNQGFTKEQVQSWPLSNGFKKGDIVFLKGTDTLTLGDVIVFRGNAANPIIHRIIDIQTLEGKLLYTTKGDANQAPSQQLKEVNILPENIVGKAMFKIPYLGWIKLVFTEIIGG